MHAEQKNWVEKKGGRVGMDSLHIILHHCNSANFSSTHSPIPHFGTLVPGDTAYHPWGDHVL